MDILTFCIAAASTGAETEKTRSGTAPSAFLGGAAAGEARKRTTMPTHSTRR